MRGSKRAHVPHNISGGDTAYPSCLTDRLGAEGPRSLTIVGSAAPLSGQITAFLCSKETPGATILKAFDQAAEWRDTGRCVISGFHSPLERQCLDILLRGKQPVVMALARAFETPRLPPAQRRALDDGRLTIVSPFTANESRTTKDRAFQRNLLIAALADEVVFGFISPGGALSRIAERIAKWGGEFRRLQG